ncbi:uncharacterized protein K02A2.6-like [Diprion similis]|uniref:uncharacterized protein K02A2.6-like n=1 Tax=Diprion similis TaxID=362088 RepID=UPI001EF92CAB|nr:uncharacterized protein K02A2.6-like [Diprion similis]
MAPEYFQYINSKNFADIEGVQIYFDDLLIAADSLDEHDKIMEKVTKRAKEVGVKFNPNKIQYKVCQVKYLGHLFDKDGMHVDPDRLQAILALKNPVDKKGLQSILGIVNFLTSAPVLTNFDSSKEVTIQTDASQSGLGCCLLQEGRSVCYASHSLNNAEKNYATIEKELLGIVFATKRFHNFIYGRNVNVVTDHKPLVSIINNKNIGDIASSRLQRMKIKLLKYNLAVSHAPGKNMYVADLLSRNHMANSKDSSSDWITEVVHSVNTSLNISDSKKKEYQTATESDSVLYKIKKYYNEGWPPDKSKVSEDIKFYYKYRNELNVEDDLVYLNYRLVVPTELRKDVLKLLHEAHLGVNKTKARARQAVYWPGLMVDIENMVAMCRVCEKFRTKNIKEPLIPHDIPDIPFNKIATDICEFMGKNFLIIQDYFSKWLEILPIANKTAAEFAKGWNFEVVTSSPTYPQSNGQAERAVQTAKNILKKCKEEDKDINLALLEYRNCPISGIAASPAQIIFSRRLRGKLPIHSNLLKPVIEPNVHEQIKHRQNIYKYYYDKIAKPRQDLGPGENIVLREGKIWEPARIIQKHSTPRSYVIKDQKGETLRRNSIHLRKSKNKYRQITDNCNNDSNCDANIKMTDNCNDDNCDVSIKNDIDDNVNTTSTPAKKGQIQIGKDSTKQTVTTRSGRSIREPSKFKDYIKG